MYADRHQHYLPEVLCGVFDLLWLWFERSFQQALLSTYTRTEACGPGINKVTNLKAGK